MKIALAIGNNPFGRYFAGIVCSLVDVDLIFVETRGPSWKFTRKKARTLGWLSVLYTALRKRILDSKAKRTISQQGLPPGVPLFVTTTVNAKKARDEMARRNIDILVIFGTSILRSRVLGVPRIGVMNLHTGVLPEYRGCQSEFWALYNSQPDKIGYTIHWVVEKIDAGNIMLVEKVYPETRDLFKIRVRNIEEGAKGFAGLLGKKKLTRDMGVSQAHYAKIHNLTPAYYSTPGLSDWIYLNAKLKR